MKMNHFLIKKSSSIHGVGIFTNKPICKSEIFYEVPTKYLFTKPTPNCAYIGDNRWVLDEDVLNYVNHSCDSNSILNISGIPKLIAKREISINEEITVDYNKTEKNGVKVFCNCKSKNCKKYFLKIE